MEGWKKAMNDIISKASDFVSLDESFSKWRNNKDINELNLEDCARDLVKVIRLLLTKFSNKGASKNTKEKALRIKLEEYENHCFKLDAFVHKLKDKSLHHSTYLKECVDSLVELVNENDMFLENVVRKCNEMKRDKEETLYKFKKMEELYGFTMEKLSALFDNLNGLCNKLADFQGIDITKEKPLFSNEEDQLQKLSLVDEDLMDENDVTKA
ncbi:uncharacterized protein LOC111636634 isoform X2 [Centruroides sculpturatus]|uniref:uncharacterized protein LOC111636634 isoform X2 n=1 Tax=Centruroides sculpturatus TaxID=218467 RepID=UPI000C6CBAA0|nr:uncharacterized protein LOC111636634 isoform X2 [Centruroides sculpturatus]